MIADAVVLQEVRDSWAGVEALRGRLNRSLRATLDPFVIFGADAAHNLPFMHASAVLNDALEQLRDEGHFKCKGRLLGTLLAASKGNLSWLDYALIEEMVHRRNDVAHRGDVLPRADCWRYIDAIKSEFLRWHIL